jgi:hypothetical protein
MELELVISMLAGMFILALLLYFFRNVLILLLGPAVGVLLHRRFSQKITETDHLLISFYLSNVKKFIKILLLNLQ